MSSKKDSNGSRSPDPLDELESLLDEGFEDERTSVVNINVEQSAANQRKSLIPKVPDTWPLRIIAFAVGLGSFGAAVKMLIKMLVDGLKK